MYSARRFYLPVNGMSIPTATITARGGGYFFIVAQHVRKIGPEPFGVFHSLTNVFYQPIDWLSSIILIVCLLSIVFPPIASICIGIGGWCLTRWTIVVSELDFPIGKLHRFVLQLLTGRILCGSFRNLFLVDNGGFIIENENIAIILHSVFALKISPASDELWFDQRYQICRSPSSAKCRFSAALKHSIGNVLASFLWVVQENRYKLQRKSMNCSMQT